jgi:hypothetical protein
MKFKDMINEGSSSYTPDMIEKLKKIEPMRERRKVLWQWIKEEKVDFKQFGEILESVNFKTAN